MSVIDNDYLEYVNNCGKVCDFVNEGQSFRDMTSNLEKCTFKYCKSKITSNCIYWTTSNGDRKWC